MITTDNTETLKNAMDEIELLNAQVAMLRHNIAWVSGLVENWSGEENGHHDRIMSQSSDEWLAAHDAKVRDDAIEEMAVEIESFRSDYDKYSVAEAVRSMKGKIMKEEGFDDDYLSAPTHQRKARKATALQWTGDNERAIAEFTHYATELHADSGWIYLREDGRLIDTIAPRSWAFYGEDGKLRILRDGEFKSRDEVI